MRERKVERARVIGSARNDPLAMLYWCHWNALGETYPSSGSRGEHVRGDMYQNNEIISHEQLANTHHLQPSKLDSQRFDDDATGAVGIPSTSPIQRAVSMYSLHTASHQLRQRW